MAAQYRALVSQMLGDVEALCHQYAATSGFHRIEQCHLAERRNLGAVKAWCSRECGTIHALPQRKGIAEDGGFTYWRVIKPALDGSLDILVTLLGTSGAAQAGALTL